MKLKMKSSNKKIEPAATTTTMFVNKKLCSKLPRRRRSHMAPFVLQKKTAHPVDSSCCSYFDAEEVSCYSSRVSYPKKRKFGESRGNEEIGDSHCRRIPRTLYKKEKEAEGNEVEVSESSCVESNSGADCRVFGERRAKVKKASNNLKEMEKNDAVSVSLDTVTRSDISCVDLIPREISKISSDNKENDLVSVTSGFEFCSTSEFDDTALIKANANNVVDANFTVSNSESVVDQKPTSFSGLDSSHLACNEQFLFEEVLSDCSSSHETAFSELQSDFFPEASDIDFSDYTPCTFFDLGSQFSEKSTDDSPTSLTYSIFLEFKEQFTRSTSPLDPKFASRAKDERQLNPTVVRFEDEEDEESYRRLRERERRQVYLRDYAKEYGFTTDYGDLILQQRSFIVRWIIEQYTAKEFQQETMFLGVCLLDRFLSKGFFKTRRTVLIVGIACLALATRIEENQRYNSVRQRNFYKEGGYTYSRNEVVAMEWLVMEVLNFQCFLPTIYNFLWFYLKAAKADAEAEKRAKYLAVTALSDHEQLSYWPSTVAAGIVIMASMNGNQHASYHQVIEIHMRTKDNDLPECMMSLDWLIQFVR